MTIFPWIQLDFVEFHGILLNSFDSCTDSTRFYRNTLKFTTFRWIPQSSTEFLCTHWNPTEFLRIYLIPIEFLWFRYIQPDFIRFHWNLFNFVEFQGISLNSFSFLRFSLNSFDSHWISLNSFDFHLNSRNCYPYCLGKNCHSSKMKKINSTHQINQIGLNSNLRHHKLPIDQWLHELSGSRVGSSLKKRGWQWERKEIEKREESRNGLYCEADWSVNPVREKELIDMNEPFKAT